MKYSINFFFFFGSCDEERNNFWEYDKERRWLSFRAFRGKRDGDDRRYGKWVFEWTRRSPELAFSGDSEREREREREKGGACRLWYSVESDGVGGGLGIYKKQLD